MRISAASRRRRAREVSRMSDEVSPHVNEAAVLADLFRHGGEKGNHIMFGRLFDLIDPVHIESGLFLDVSQGV